MRGLALDLEVRRVGNKQEGSVRSLKSEVQLLRCVIDAMKFFDCIQSENLVKFHPKHESILKTALNCLISSLSSSRIVSLPKSREVFEQNCSWKVDVDSIFLFFCWFGALS